MTPAAPVRYRFPAELRELGRRHAVVEASAGTGKTYILEHLVVDLLLRQDVPLEQILVVTFTEKATAELSERVRRKLQELRDLTADHPASAGAADADCWLIDERARRKLDTALHGFDRASISTIHAFCQRLLGEHAFFNRRLFGEEVIDEEDAFKVAFAESLRRDVVADPGLARLLEIWIGVGMGFDRLQRAVLRALRGLACLHPPRPGALRPAALDEAAVIGAARALVDVDPARLKEALARRKVHPSTVKSVVSKLSELREAAAACREPGEVPLLLATIDAIDRNRDGALETIRGHLEKNAADPEVARIGGIFADFHQQAVPLMGAVVGRLLPLVAARLEGHKREAGLFDFQDMLTLTARSLDGDGDGEGARALLATLRARYRHALIDEFQDTDEVQWSIFRRIFFDSPQGHVLTVIGDPKQAIYSFRGADVHTYLGARRAIEGAGGPILHLRDNFRSSAPLIDAYNAILDQAAPFFRPEGGILYDHPVRCGRPEASAGGEPAVVVLDLETQAKDLLTWQIKRSLLARMANEMGRLVRTGEGGGPIRAGDIFVLARTIRECREVGDALRAVGVPHAFYKQEKLFDTIEAREVLDLLRAIADPDDVTARGRAFITPFFGLSLTDLAACDDLDGSHALLRLLYEWRALAEAGDFETLFARVVDDSGIVCREVFWNPSERSLTNYLHLLELLQEEAARTRATIRELAQTLGAYIRGTRRPPGDARDLQRLETDADAVQIMTIHHAKGLEADWVFLYGGFWPGPASDVRTLHEEDDRRVVRVGRQPAAERERYEAEQADEERRVLYVALTRARRRLYLPRFPAAFRQLRGCYRFINERLDDLFGGFTPPEVQALFRRVPVRCPEEALAPLAPAPPSLVAAWSPPAELLAPVANPAPFTLDALARQRAGFLVTSYTAVKRLHPGVPAHEVSDPSADETAGDEAGGVELPDNELPRGRVTGRFVHEVLEELPLEPLAGPTPPPVGEWASRPEVAALFERKRSRHDVHPDHLAHAHELVHAALTAPVALGEVVVPGLAGVARALREVEFFYPIPERAHRLLEGAPSAAGTATDGRGFRIERGVVKGYIDLLFEHAGRTYVCDWKGDWLPDWEAGRLQAHCAGSYGIQVELYTLATLRMIDVNDEAAYQQRFGGVLFCFVRGMPGRAEGAARGVHFQRPSWQDVLAWQRKLLGGSYWGLS